MSGTTINIPEIRILRVGMSDRPEDITGTGEIPEELRRLVEGIENQFKANREEEEKADELKEIEESANVAAAIDHAYYKALVREGFTQEQAFEIIIAKINRG